MEVLPQRPFVVVVVVAEEHRLAGVRTSEDRRPRIAAQTRFFSEIHTNPTIAENYSRTSRHVARRQN